MWRTFSQTLGLWLALLSSGFWIRSAITMRDNVIAALSSTGWGYNIEVAKNLCHQRADALVAVVLLMASAVCQMIALWRPGVVFASNRKGVILACGFFILVWIGACVLSERLYIDQFRRVEIILKAGK